MTIHLSACRMTAYRSNSGCRTILPFRSPRVPSTMRTRFDPSGVSISTRAGRQLWPVVRYPFSIHHASMPPFLPADRALALACSIRTLRHQWLDRASDLYGVLS